MREEFPLTYGHSNTLKHFLQILSKRVNTSNDFVSALNNATTVLMGLNMWETPRPIFQGSFFFISREEISEKFVQAQ